jgi:hypothetical protein
MRKNSILIILLFIAVITLSFLNSILYFKINNFRHESDYKEKLTIQKVYKKEFLEVEIGLEKLNSNMLLVDKERRNFTITSIETPTLVFYFNNDGCKSCNANYIESEFRRIKSLVNNIPDIKVIVLSNFKDFREFYSHSLSFGGNERINCYNMMNDLFAPPTIIEPDLFYFVIDKNYSLDAVFLPDYIFEENNIKYFDLIINKIRRL